MGEAVSIVLPSNAATPGTVTAVGPRRRRARRGSRAAGGRSVRAVQRIHRADGAPRTTRRTGTGSGVAVQVSLTTQSASDVLAVPVSALLALAGGGYGVEVVGPSGAHRLVGVTTGSSPAGRSRSAGRASRPGTKVVVAQ